MKVRNGQVPMFKLQEKNTQSEEVSAIERTVQLYFDSYLNADADGLAKAFHPESRLYSVDDGKLEKTELSAWLENLRARKEKGDIRKAEVKIGGVDVSGNAAVVKTTLKFSEFQFIDYLSLLKTKTGWIVINKIYTVRKNAL